MSGAVGVVHQAAWRFVVAILSFLMFLEGYSTLC